MPVRGLRREGLHLPAVPAPLGRGATFARWAKVGQHPQISVAEIVDVAWQWLQTVGDLFSFGHYTPH